MNYKIKILVLTISLICIFSYLHAQQNFEPILHNGKKWRIAYYEGGAYSEYTDTMRTLLNGLIALKWITDYKLPNLQGEITKPYIKWLSEHPNPYFEFRLEDCYSANWDDNTRKKNKEHITKKLQAGSIDLVIAMGTIAGLDLVNNTHSVPVMVMSTSDPIRTGIIKSITDSGFDHVTARVDPTRYSRQLRMFHRIVAFKTLGVVIEGARDDQNYSAMEEVNNISKERGFKVKTCNFFNTSDSCMDNRCCDCYKKLLEEVDAIYVTGVLCADTQTKNLAEMFKIYKIPSFSMFGSKWVKEGILMSISSDSGYDGLSKYNADKFVKILYGFKPRSLNQIFEDPLEIAINVNTAKEIGFKIPTGILKISTEIYE